MLSCEEIISNIESRNLIAVELLDIENTVIKLLKNNSMDDFLNFVGEYGCKRIYFGYISYDVRKFKISIAPYDALSSKGCNKVEIYNSFIDSLDFTKPYKLIIFASIDSILIGVEEVDDWIQDEDVVDPHELLKVVKEDDEDDYDEELMERRKEYNDLIKDDKTKLIDTILDDPDFRLIKTQETRYWYLLELIGKPEMKEYREFLKPYGAYRFGNVKMFMDEVNMKYKEREKNQKHL